MNLKSKIIIVLLTIFLLMATGSAIYFWYAKPSPVSKTEYIKVPSIKTIEKIKRVEVPVEKIVTIEKTVIVEKLKLPDWFKNDAGKQAIATATIPPYEGNTSAISIIDTTTGVGEIIAKQEPLSLMSFINQKELYGKFGYTTAKEIQVSIGGRWLFGRIGNIKIGAYAEGMAEFATDKNNSSGVLAGGIVIVY